uniref:DDE-1 domain-containing protein n=1 Tax=Trichuris muris TaxID=70415 RepID=A0A5S6QSY8_TRIMR
MKDAVYAVANAWDAVTKKTITGAWHNLWPAANRRDLSEQRDNTEDLTEEKMTADLLRYANSLPSESISKLEEVDIEEVFNIDNEAPTAFSLTDGEIAEMVLNDCEHNGRGRREHRKKGFHTGDSENV